MVERIDAFSHVMPEAFYKVTGAHEDHPLGPEIMWDIEGRIQVMDEFDIDKQVINLAPPNVWNGMGMETALQLTKLANNEVKAMADQHPDRFIPVGTIPMVNMEFVEEFDRCVNELSMAGVQIFTHVDSKPMDSEEFTPLYELADSEGAPLWLHPQDNNMFEWIDQDSMNIMLAWPFQTTLAITRLVLGGVMDRFPNLKVITHHMGGGMIPFFGDRIRSFCKTRRESNNDSTGTDWGSSSKPVEEFFTDFYADTGVSGSLAAMECGYEFFGPDQIVFSTDYPYGAGKGRQKIRSTKSMIDRMGFDDETREKIYGGNLKTIL